MDKVHLAILWHQHQPYYPDDATGEVSLPWVRLHAIKDYWGMARLIEEVPEVRLTINLVPSLIAQVEGYVAGDLVDRYERLARLAPEDLSESDRLFIVANFFKANPETMVRPHERYHELWVRRDPRRRDAPAVLDRFSDRDVMDLQVWHTLAWFHPILKEADPAVSALVRKGRDFTAADKEAMFARCREVASEVVPMHRRLAGSGQVELTTTPYYHPIVPLLLDMSDARRAMPGVGLPRNAFQNEADAREQVRRAVRFHEERFGAPPRGMWPSEGSVSSRVVPLLASEGIGWIGTDEEVLLRSLGHSLRQGPDHAPDEVYRPWRAEHDGASVDMIFRDHVLSDLLGFDYQRMDAEAAARDFVGRLHRIADSQSGGPALVSVILDGENAWESYPGGGVPFLRAFYRAMAADDRVETVKPGEFLAANPPSGVLPDLWPGSWIHHDFRIWIGHQEDRLAWERIYDARAALVEAGPGLDPEARRRAWEEVYIAEGSDWYWWFGDDHSSMDDAEFDDLFRRHCANVWRAMGKVPPAALDEPIKKVRRRGAYTSPTALLGVDLDGLATSYFEWLGAGRYDPVSGHGAMDRTTANLIETVWFGADAARLLVRCDPAVEASAFYASGRRLVIEAEVEQRQPSSPRASAASEPARGEPVRALVPLDGPGRGEAGPCAWAAGRVVEVAIAFAAIGVGAGDTVRFHIALEGPGGPIERAPATSDFRFARPGDDFGADNWVV